MNLDVLRLLPAFEVILSTRIEYTPDSFQELTPVQLEIYKTKVGTPQGKVYRIVPLEPTVIDRVAPTEDHPGKVVWELNVVTEQQRADLLAAVKVIHQASTEVNRFKPSFEERLDFMNQRKIPKRKKPGR
jgi:hypothetical protein